jgi:hypothetical protein
LPSNNAGIGELECKIFILHSTIKKGEYEGIVESQPSTRLCMADDNVAVSALGTLA